MGLRCCLILRDWLIVVLAVWNCSGLCHFVVGLMLVLVALRFICCASNLPRGCALW